MFFAFLVVFAAVVEGQSCSNLTACQDCRSSTLACGWCQSSATCLAPGGNLSSCSSGVSFGSSIDCFNCQGSFFPCANNLSTSIFLIIFYGLIILVCAKITSMGAEMLLELYPNRGSVIGALLLPILGSFPDACMIVASGALGTVAEAQEQLNVGIGALAGSTVMLLTLPWTAVLFAGACDIDDNNQAIDQKRTSWSLIKVGITLDSDTRYNARIMCFSMLFFFIVQVRSQTEKNDCFVLIKRGFKQGVCFAFVNDQEVSPQLVAAEYPAAVAGFAVCFAALACYIVFQLKLPSVAQKRTARKEIEIAERKEKLEALFVVRHFPGALRPALDSRDRVHANLLHFARIWKEMANNMVPLEYEFEQNVAHVNKHVGVKTIRKNSFSLDLDVPVEEQDEDEMSEHDPRRRFRFHLFVCISMMAGASFVIAVFSDPLVQTMSTFGFFINISPFYIAFVVSPILGNATELVASISFATRKRKENTSMSVAGLYGSVVMNNTLGLGIFFALIAFRGLVGAFVVVLVLLMNNKRGETMSIVLATVAVGLPACFILTYHLYWVFLNLPVYGLCIVFVWLLETKAGIL